MDFTKPYNRAEWIDFLETRFMPNDFNINVIAVLNKLEIAFLDR